MNLHQLQLPDHGIKNLAKFPSALLRIALLTAFVVDVRDAEARLVSFGPFEVAVGPLP